MHLASFAACPKQNCYFLIKFFFQNGTDEKRKSVVCIYRALYAYVSLHNVDATSEMHEIEMAKILTHHTKQRVRERENEFQMKWRNCNYNHCVGRQLCLPVFVPPVNIHAPVVFAAFSNPLRISCVQKEKKRKRVSGKVVEMNKKIKILKRKCVSLLSTNTIIIIVVVVIIISQLHVKAFWWIYIEYVKMAYPQQCVKYIQCLTMAMCASPCACQSIYGFRLFFAHARASSQRYVHLFI